MNLYEIEEEILKCVDYDTGEIFDVERFEELGFKRDEKIKNIAMWIKNLKYDVEMLKAEEKNLKSRRESKERKIESLSNYLSGFLNGEKYEDAQVKVSFRTTQKVVIDDFDKLLSDYLKVKVDATPDKDKIKKAIKEGIQVDGARIEDGLSMTVK